MDKLLRRMMRSAVAAGLSAIMLFGGAATAHAASNTVTLPNGCRIQATNRYSSNKAEATTSKVAGYTCFKIEVNFLYYDDASGQDRNKTSLYLNAASVTISQPTTVKPSHSNHNAIATSGGVAWGFPLNF